MNQRMVLRVIKKKRGKKEKQEQKYGKLVRVERNEENGQQNVKYQKLCWNVIKKIKHETYCDDIEKEERTIHR